MVGTSPLTPRSFLRAWWAQRSPAAGAAVMATGILAVGLRLRGYEVLSWIALVVACAAWLGLAADFVVRLLRERSGWVAEAGSPGALTAVAATTVLGAGFATLGPLTLAEALLALSALLWPVLLVLVVGHWKRRMPGAVFLGCVATQGLAVLAATLAGKEATAWLAHAALVLFWLGLVLYGIALARFDLRQVTEGLGDHWIAGGALGISALAGAKLLAADSARLYLWNEDDSAVLRAVTVALLVLDLACIRRTAARRAVAAAGAAALRRAPLGDRVPDGHDGDGDPVRRRGPRRPVAGGAGRGAAVGRGGGLAGRRRGSRRGGRCRGRGHVHNTAMKMFAVVSTPTRPNRPLSTFSSSRFT